MTRESVFMSDRRKQDGNGSKSTYMRAARKQKQAENIFLHQIEKAQTMNDKKSAARDNRKKFASEWDSDED